MMIVEAYLEAIITKKTTDRIILGKIIITQIEITKKIIKLMAILLVSLIIEIKEIINESIMILRKHKRMKTLNMN